MQGALLTPSQTSSWTTRALRNGRCMQINMQPTFSAPLTLLELASIMPAEMQFRGFPEQELDRRLSPHSTVNPVWSFAWTDTMTPTWVKMQFSLSVEIQAPDSKSQTFYPAAGKMSHLVDGAGEKGRFSVGLFHCIFILKGHNGWWCRNIATEARFHPWEWQLEFSEKRIGSVTNLFTDSHWSEWPFIPAGICAVTSNVMHIS